MRSEPKIPIGASVHGAYHDVRGSVVKADWSVSFGQPTYLITRSHASRYGAQAGDQIWVCESDLTVVSGTTHA